MDIARMHEQAGELVELLRLQSMPIALKMLRSEADTGCGLPNSPSFAVEYPLDASYVELAHAIGMDWVR